MSVEGTRSFALNAKCSIEAVPCMCALLSCVCTYVCAYAGPYLFKEVDVSELAATLAQNEQQGKGAGMQQCALMHNTNVCAHSKDTYIHTSVVVITAYR